VIPFIKRLLRKLSFISINARCIPWWYISFGPEICDTFLSGLRSDDNLIPTILSDTNLKILSYFVQLTVSFINTFFAQDSQCAQEYLEYLLLSYWKSKWYHLSKSWYINQFLFQLMQDWLNCYRVLYIENKLMNNWLEFWMQDEA